MKWNWQQPDWPRFRWNREVLWKAEDVFLVDSGLAEGATRHLAAAEREQLVVEAICDEAVATSEIEGEILDRASVQTSLRREFGLRADGRRVRLAERGIAAMLGDLALSFAAPLTHETLHGWHRSLLASRAEMEDLGRYRTGNAPMQVVSGPVHSLRVHFEAPPASALAEQMARFVHWFNRTDPDGDAPLPAVTRAGVAHLYFESVHPFEDGNGRIGRAISEKALAQALGRPTLVALAATILLRRKAYYRALEAATRSNEITAWLRWFAGVAIEAQRRGAANVEFLIDKTRLLDRLRGRLNARQEKALLRVLREGPDGFAGGLSTGNYVTITNVSSATARRDLAGLVSKGALTRTGKRRYTRYHLAIPTRTVQPVVVCASGDVKPVAPA